MSNQVAIPEYLKAYMDQSTISDADSMSSVKTSVPRISLKGKRFKFINGEEESKGTDKIHVAILAVEPIGGGMAKTFYKNGYNPNDTAPPDCSSQNGIFPDSWVTEPVSNKCAGCPNNLFGSATSMSGKKSKACKDSKTLWVAKVEDVKGMVYGLKVPVTSLKSMSEYGKIIKGIGAPLAAVITEISMDEDNEYPLLHFSNLGFLNAELAPVAIERSQSREWITSDAPAIEHKAETSNKIQHDPSKNVTVDGESKDVTQNDSNVGSVAENW